MHKECVQEMLNELDDVVRRHVDKNARQTCVIRIDIVAATHGDQDAIITMGADVDFIGEKR